LLKLGKDVKVHETARINVEDGVIGDRSVIGANTVIEGRSIRIGHEAWIDEYSYIGGGSCFDPWSSLEAGDFLHMGRFSHLNPGRGLKIGHEFGCGINTKIFTHGAYECAWEGFPVQWAPVKIGDRVWMPNAWVNPGVNVGNDVVVAAMSLVSKDLPDGCLAGGIPCKVLKENMYPRKLDAAEKKALFERIFSESRTIYESRCSRDKAPPKSFESSDEDTYSIAGTTFDLCKRSIEGKATEFSEVLKNQLRRNGIRFRFCAKGSAYEKW
jgi:acetyltransferase-like isoleucine patch superfamily enzyme